MDTIGSNNLARDNENEQEKHGINVDNKIQCHVNRGRSDMSLTGKTGESVKQDCKKNEKEMIKCRENKYVHADTVEGIVNAGFEKERVQRVVGSNLDTDNDTKINHNVTKCDNNERSSHGDRTVENDVISRSETDRHLPEYIYDPNGRLMKKKLRKKKKKELSKYTTWTDSGVESEKTDVVRKIKQKRKRDKKRSDRNIEEKNEHKEPLDPRCLNELWIGANYRRDTHLQQCSASVPSLKGIHTSHDHSNTSQQLLFPHLYNQTTSSNTFNVFSTPDQNCGTSYQTASDGGRVLRKKRGFLKKTSAKIGIVHPNGPPPLISSRLEIDKTARTERGQDVDLEPEQEFPEPLKGCKLITRFPVICFCKYEVVSVEHKLLLKIDDFV